MPVSVPGFRRALAVLLARLRVLSDDRRRRPALLARYEARGGEPQLRIVVVTAEVGEGHAAAARALAADLAGERADVEVLICDALAGLGRVLRYVLLDVYRWQLRSAPWIFGLLYRLFARVSLFRGLGRAGLALFGARGLLRLIDRYRPDIVVSTFPAATSVLGYLRRRGRVTVPVCATATDLAGLEFWAHPGIDRHLVMHAACVAPVERVAGVGSAWGAQTRSRRKFARPRTLASWTHTLPGRGSAARSDGQALSFSASSVWGVSTRFRLQIGLIRDVQPRNRVLTPSGIRHEPPQGARRFGSLLRPPAKCSRTTCRPPAAPDEPAAGRLAFTP